MNSYRQDLLIQARPSAVYKALTTATGLRSWWTQDCDVALTLGATHRFRFGPHHKDMRLEQLEPDRLVRWRCTDAWIDLPQLSRKDEWTGTEIVFHLEGGQDGPTRLVFEHRGLVPAFDCYTLCDEGWRHFLGSLQQYSETGRGTPHQLALSGAH